MLAYADMAVKCDKRIGASIIDDLTKLPYRIGALSAWDVALKETTAATATLGEPCLYFFYYCGADPAPYALLALNYNAGEYSLQDGRLYIANIVPKTKSELDTTEYESIAKQFHDAVLKPFLSKKYHQLAISISAPRNLTPSISAQTQSQTKQQFVSFSITDASGQQFIYSCDPDGLGNFFGKNPNAPRFTTPVYFSIGVLDKYRNVPDLYDVEEGCLRGISNGSVDWCISIDNHGTDYVTVLLGDLGSLPTSEQHHFASFNISNGQMSAAFQKNQFSAEFCNSTHPVGIFKIAYQKLYDTFADKLGWVIILPLEEADRHHLKALKLLTNDDQKEFDEQVLSLSKILVDSLNVEQLKLYNVSPIDAGSINLLEAVVNSKAIKGGDAQVAFLRKLQNLRSASSAHRKGEKYDKAAQKVGLGVKTKTEVFQTLIEDATRFCQFLTDNVAAF